MKTTSRRTVVDAMTASLLPGLAASILLVVIGCGTRPFARTPHSSVASPAQAEISATESSSPALPSSTSKPRGSESAPSLLPVAETAPSHRAGDSPWRDPLAVVPTAPAPNSTSPSPSDKADPAPTAPTIPDPSLRSPAVTARSIPTRLVDGRYPVQPGDQLEILFHEAWAPDGEYRILPGDQVRLEFLGGATNLSSDPQRLDRTVTVQPDGKLALPFIGVVNAAGATVPELTETLKTRYREIYVEPELLVSLASTGHGLRDLRETVFASAGRTTVVAPDGTITVPHLGIVKVEGLNLEEIQDEINERYRRALPGFMVTVRLAGER